jgi:hypothetical protein
MRSLKRAATEFVIFTSPPTSQPGAATLKQYRDVWNNNHLKPRMGIWASYRSELFAQFTGADAFANCSASEIGPLFLRDCKAAPCCVENCMPDHVRGLEGFPPS